MLSLVDLSKAHSCWRGDSVHLGRSGAASSCGLHDRQPPPRQDLRMDAYTWRRKADSGTPPRSAWNADGAHRADDDSEGEVAVQPSETNWWRQAESSGGQQLSDHEVTQRPGHHGLQRWRQNRGSSSSGGRGQVGTDDDCRGVGPSGLRCVWNAVQCLHVVVVDDAAAADVELGRRGTVGGPRWHRYRQSAGLEFVADVDGRSQLSWRCHPAASSAALPVRQRLLGRDADARCRPTTFFVAFRRKQPRRFDYCNWRWRCRSRISSLWRVGSTGLTRCADRPDTSDRGASSNSGRARRHWHAVRLWSVARCPANSPPRSTATTERRDTRLNAVDDRPLWPTAATPPSTAAHQRPLPATSPISVGAWMRHSTSAAVRQVTRHRRPRCNSLITGRSRPSTIPNTTTTGPPRGTRTVTRLLWRDLLLIKGSHLV